MDGQTQAQIFTGFRDHAQLEVYTGSFGGKMFIQFREVEIIVVVAGSISFPQPAVFAVA